tara:strand:- start:292 stop:477 length:186 start_codon:yes stop_codon:yes gene_type:complete
MMLGLLPAAAHGSRKAPILKRERRYWFMNGFRTADHVVLDKRERQLLHVNNGSSIIQRVVW